MNGTLADFNAMLAGQGTFQNHIRRFIAASRGSYQDFIDQLYVDLDACIHGLRTIVEQVQDDGEDRLTSDIVLQMRQQGYQASHDRKSGGHVDVSVELGPHSWIGEAKLNWNIDEGLRQLTTRYVAASGDPKHDHGGLLFYLVRTEDTNAVMLAWRAELEANSIECVQCPNNPLAFYSQVKLPGTGLPYHVRSVGVALYFNPQDASGRRTAERRKKGERKAQQRGAKKR